ncbi:MULTISPECIES: pyrroline-5-carboxylate reductase family protein [Rhizobium/Agrobacterium group]|uniref:pyrroline-5-carboxylate reductase family protein n=1 Tax=Agrobacterium rosae TaxID=1972867 RepID=UPI002033ED4D|nr:NAD(P)-binding domain-containing protein [Agrobacterium rosae]MCM2436086.1 NAD(P)-binding domain-containing protein [Agrobacterium rosae]
MTLSNNLHSQLSKAGSTAEFANAHIGIIGTGAIAAMLVHCLARAFPDTRLLVAGRNASALSQLVAGASSASTANYELVATKADYIFLAVPPEAYSALLSQMRTHLRPETVIITLTNSISLTTLGNFVDNPIVKVIPTIAHRVGRGSTIVVSGPRANSAVVGKIVSLLSHFSTPVVIDDGDSRIASNLAGSALALFSEFARLLISAHEGREGSLSQGTLNQMTAETMGAIGDLVRDGYDFQGIINATAAPGGMTEAAVRILRSSCEAPVKATIEETFRRQKTAQNELDQSEG